jgi:uncharacterized protein (UPF0332 family)/predicted nucleotidyltransferase
MRTATLTHDPKLSRIASALRDAFGARLASALLLGSRARGDHRPDSDYDIAVFLDNFARERDRETLDKAREALGEDAWTLQLWPFASDGLAERTTLTFNIRNEATPLPGFEWPTIIAPPIMPDEGSMEPETKVLLDSARQSLTAARSLNAKGFPKHAAREAHQGALRAARALIFEERNSAPTTHRGTNTLFSEIAVRTGRVPDELFGALTGGLDLRMDLDYEPIPKTTDQQAVDYLDRAERFVALVHILLERGQA